MPQDFIFWCNFMPLLRQDINFDGSKKNEFLRKAENEEEMGQSFKVCNGVVPISTSLCFQADTVMNLLRD